MNRGRLITIEGIDGAGKTTLATALVGALRDRGIDVLLLREPGGVPAAERIRDLVIDPELHVTARTEALLYAAARAQLVEEALEPLLSQGKWVLLDRFIDSSLAYQGGGRELGIDAVRAINEFAIRTARPDRTLLLRVDPELFFAVPVLAFAVLAFDLELDRVAVEAFCVIAVPTLPKSASACLLVFAASRRSAVNAAVTSL